MRKIFCLMLLLTVVLLVSCKKMSGGTYNYLPNYSGNTEEYNTIIENKYHDVLSSPLSTFSIDVDTASYSNVRRYLNMGELPPQDAVRTEELINYFNYDYLQAENGDPINIITEVAACPWYEGHQLVMIALKGTNLDTEDFPPSNLVFLLDVSGSMADYNKLPLVKSSMKLLVSNLRDKDRVSIVTYSNSVHTVLATASGSEKDKINHVIDNLKASGSTAGASGIQTAYNLASRYYINGGNNRVILATDGDFNVGISNEGDLKKFIAEKRDTGIYLSVLGFGMGNIKDNKMEALADSGNGNYAYIDTLSEAKKVLTEQMSGTLLTIAKDVKIQTEFNPANIKAYRLVGYENRVLDNSDFNNDNVDAGEIGAGFAVTAFYEIVPSSSTEVIAGVDDLKYQEVNTANIDELMTVKLRYKLPDSDTSILRNKIIRVAAITNTPSENFRFASAVAEFGLLIRNSRYKGDADYDRLIEQASSAKGNDVNGWRAEFIRLAGLARDLSGSNRSE